MSTRIPRALASLLSLPEQERRIGPFVLLRQLGRGGFAPVWLAKEVYGETEVRTAAVKLFAFATEDGATREEAARRHDQVIHETRALCQVEHPNIVRFYTLLIDDARGVVGLAMEYVKGVGLDERLQAGPLSVREAVDVGAAVASALAAVHRAGLVHRDVKPANVIDATGLYKLIDFGIASGDAPAPAARTSKRVVLDDLPLDAIGTKMSALTTSIASEGDSASSMVISTGTVGYIDPATIALAAPAAPASDLYALGALLYECLAGVLPAAAGGAAGTGLRGEVLDGRSRAVPVRSLAPAIPAELGDLVDALLSPDRAERPASADEVARTLQRIRAGLDDPHDAPAPQTKPSQGARGEESPWRAAAWIALAAIGGVGAVGLYALQHRRAEPAAPTAAPSVSAPVVKEPAATTAPAASRCPDEMALVPGGTFQMGSPDGIGDDDEHPRHAVTVAAFCMDVNEVTVAAYDRCFEAKACRTPAGTGGVCNSGRADRRDHPVNCVDWGDAATYCDLQKQRLPTEEEWEYAATGGSEQRIYPWGNDPPSVEPCWNGTGNDAGKAKRKGTCPIGRHPAGRSRWGIDDLAGNAWEWVSSPYCPYGGAVCTDRSKRVIRGGGWFNDDAANLRAANRYKSDPSERFVGFRCAAAPIAAAR